MFENKNEKYESGIEETHEQVVDTLMQGTLDQKYEQGEQQKGKRGKNK
jgi:hypothetical protein